MSNTNTAKLDRMQADLTEIRRLMTGLNKFIAEAVLQPDQLQRMVTGAWVHAYPNKGLTWNVEMRGEGFLSLMLGGAETQNTKHKTRNTKHETRNEGTVFGDVLEVGPGYGRVLRALLEHEQKQGKQLFASYLGVDLSEHNVAHLQEKYGSERIRFVNGNILTTQIDERFDTIYGSAVFLHIYPDIAEVLNRTNALLRPGGRVCFDVPIGNHSYIDPQYKLFVRQYTEPVLRQYLGAAGFRHIAIEPEPEFAPGEVGLFVRASVNAVAPTKSTSASPVGCTASS